jgi:hypothetical protein
MRPISIIIHLGILRILLATEAPTDFGPAEAAYCYGCYDDDLYNDQTQLF